MIWRRVCREIGGLIRGMRRGRLGGGMGRFFWRRWWWFLWIGELLWAFLRWKINSEVGGCDSVTSLFFGSRPPYTRDHDSSRIHIASYSQLTE